MEYKPIADKKGITGVIYDSLKGGYKVAMHEGDLLLRTKDKDRDYTPIQVLFIKGDDGQTYIDFQPRKDAEHITAYEMDLTKDLSGLTGQKKQEKQVLILGRLEELLIEQKTKHEANPPIKDEFTGRYITQTSNPQDKVYDQVKSELQFHKSKIDDLMIGRGEPDDAFKLVRLIREKRIDMPIPSVLDRLSQCSRHYGM